MKNYRQIKSDAQIDSEIRATEAREKAQKKAADRANAIGAASVAVALVTVAALLVYGFANFVS